MVSITLIAKASDSLYKISNSVIFNKLDIVLLGKGKGINNFIASTLFSTKETTVLL